MGFPSLGYLCRRTAIANINQLTYVPEELPLDRIMDILRCVPTAGLLKVIQTNSPHMLQHDQLETLWERFCKKEFSFRLREKIEAHRKEFGEGSCFPVVPWEDVYNTLAQEEFLRLREDTALLASRTMQLNQEKTKKQTTILADPRMLIKSRAKGPRGSAARGPRNALQKAAEETRQLAMQRKQAIANASKPPTKIDVAPKGLQDALRQNAARVIKAPVKRLTQKRAVEDVRDKRHDQAEKRSITPPSTQSTTNNTSSVKTAVKTALPKTPEKLTPARKGLFASSKPVSMKGMPPIEIKRTTHNSNGTVTTSVSIDWTVPRNKQILETYTAAEKAAALSKPATTTTVTAAEYKKRNSSAISTDDSASASGSASNSAASPSADEDTTRPLPPIKRRKVAPSLFMAPKVVARPRTHD